MSKRNLGHVAVRCGTVIENSVTWRLLFFPIKGLTSYGIKWLVPNFTQFLKLQTGLGLLIWSCNVHCTIWLSITARIEQVFFKKINYYSASYYEKNPRDAVSLVVVLLKLWSSNCPILNAFKIPNSFLKFFFAMAKVYILRQHCVIISWQKQSIWLLNPAILKHCTYTCKIFCLVAEKWFRNMEFVCEPLVISPCYLRICRDQ